ncbi:YhhN-like protein-domain-containing protein [Gamsiella multidivaricata]|uniref:YhhN-like protein-domain-containing protein n=1 Tax=Gamsiella multidivaricata TaxID=101098 RepID=UPI002221201A|nr:YhhN-like protein-domain-containing protein [Gamsiella multidivaricata]KAG0352661.1 hypothetical protein BGZ54_002631 [Gamsiella multidivaricata]KAI7826557.1 YhhN-like protein-domain-containing protein [Gamsiella multidivaricata]
MSSLQALAQPLLDFVQPIALSPLNIGVQITAVALPCLLLSETANSTLGRWIFKPLASLGFIVAALSYIPNNATSFAASQISTLTSFSTLSEISDMIAATGVSGLLTAYAGELKHILFNVAPAVMTEGFHTTYTRAMMGAFVLGYIGDVLLIPAWGFLPGLASFLAGHAAFMVAFTIHGQDMTARQRGLGFVVAMAATVGPWLLPKIKDKVMRGAVVAYMLVISGMVLTAFGSVNSGQDYLPERIVGALMFFFSDLFVARQQFVHQTTFNKWIGLPLYYVAQLLLASTLRSQHVLN